MKGELLDTPHLVASALREDSHDSGDQQIYTHGTLLDLCRGFMYTRHDSFSFSLPLSGCNPIYDDARWHMQFPPFFTEDADASDGANGSRQRRISVPFCQMRRQCDSGFGRWNDGKCNIKKICKKKNE